MPKRIKRKRTNGWKMPPNTVYVGRPTIFGNPFKVLPGIGYTPMFCITQFRKWLAGYPRTGGGGLRRLSLLAHLKELRGKNLACWCPLDQPCHADVLLEIANAPASKETRD
jgi:hypothetical protein